MAPRWAWMALAVGVAIAPPSPLAAAQQPIPGLEQIAPGLLRSAAGSVLRVGTSGLVVVDPRAHRGVPSEWADAPPVRAYVITSADSLSRQDAMDAMDAMVVMHRGISAHAMRVVAFDADYVLHVDEMRVEIEHVGRGRTGSDSVAFFPDLRAVALGGLFTHGKPEPDCADGGSYAGWAAALTHALWFDFDVAIPRHGAPVGKPELRALRARLQALAEAGAACAR